jgi:UDP-N-acetylmuramyl pentapeptide phosphotransferase/UDP-N-acetylglucosamine-1-phosphate transferase
LLQIAGSGAGAAALILPLYYLMDASITLARRVLKRERFWEAHRQHFYQRALIQGHPAKRIISVVTLLNTALIAIAVVVTAIGSLTAALFGLASAAFLVGGVLAVAETKP